MICLRGGGVGGEMDGRPHGRQPFAQLGQIMVYMVERVGFDPLRPAAQSVHIIQFSPGALAGGVKFARCFLQGGL
jgi:hypothetical protein